MCQFVQPTDGKTFTRSGCEERIDLSNFAGLTIHRPSVWICVYASQMKEEIFRGVAHSAAWSSDNRHIACHDVQRSPGQTSAPAVRLMVYNSKRGTGNLGRCWK